LAGAAGVEELELAGAALELAVPLGFVFFLCFLCCVVAGVWLAGAALFCF